FAAVRTILLADFIMSLDNVIAVAAAAKGSLFLLIFGLALSIPLMVFGSTLMIRLMTRFPIVVTLGAALIGWVGGETLGNDIVLRDVMAQYPWLHLTLGVLGALGVIGLGRWMAARGGNDDDADQVVGGGSA